LEPPAIYTKESSRRKKFEAVEGVIKRPKKEPSKKNRETLWDETWSICDFLNEGD